MRHRKAARKLGRNTSHRRALLRNMMTSLFKHEQLETTDAKAKELKSAAEKVITLAKRGDLHARRQTLACLQEKKVTHRLFEELKDRFSDRQGGYVRIVKKGFRKGDGAPISIVQLVTPQETRRAKKKKADSKQKGDSKSVKPEKEPQILAGKEDVEKMSAPGREEKLGQQE